MKNTFRFFLIFLITFIILIITLWIVPTPKAATGTVHPEFSTLLKSSGNIVDIPLGRYLAYAFGLGVIGCFAFLLYVGTNKKNKEAQSGIRKVYWLTFIAYVFVYTLTFWSYLDYHDGISNNYFGGFPAPTAWMLYGMWFVPGILTLAYIFKFQNWILTEEEEAEFYEIVKARRAREKLK